MVRRSQLLGKRVLIVYKTIHHDRAGETGSQTEVLGEVVAIDARNGAVVVTDSGLHLRCPASRLYRAPAEGVRSESLGGVVSPEYVAGHLMSRDFFAGVQSRHMMARWLDRTSVLEALGLRG